MDRPSSQPSQGSIASSSQPLGPSPVGPDGFRVPTIHPPDRREIIGSWSTSNGSTYLNRPLPAPPFLYGSLPPPPALEDQNWRYREASIASSRAPSTYLRETPDLETRSQRSDTVGAQSTTSSVTSTGSTSGRDQPFRWTDDLDGIIIDCLAENVDNGRRSDNAWKQSVYVEAAGLVNGSDLGRCRADAKMVQNRIAYVSRVTNDLRTT